MVRTSFGLAGLCWQQDQLLHHLVYTYLVAQYHGNKNYTLIYSYTFEFFPSPLPTNISAYIPVLSPSLHL